MMNDLASIFSTAYILLCLNTGAIVGAQGVQVVEDRDRDGSPGPLPTYHIPNSPLRDERQRLMCLCTHGCVCGTDTRKDPTPPPFIKSRPRRGASFQNQPSAEKRL